MELLHQRGFSTRCFNETAIPSVAILIVQKYVDFKSRSRNVWYEMVFFVSLQ